MSFRIGIGQMNSRDDKAANLIVAETLIDGLAERGGRLIMLPEYFLFLGDVNDIARNAEPADGPSLDRIREKAVSHCEPGRWITSAGWRLLASGARTRPIRPATVGASWSIPGVWW